MVPTAARSALSPAAMTAARVSPLVMADPDFDLVIVGCGVGGHGAALHAVSKGLKVAVVAGEDVGGTCVNRGCVPSKALLAAAGRVREMRDEKHLADLGITVNGVSYEREKVAAHANNLASKVARNLGGSLDALGITTFMEKGEMVGPTEVKLVGNAEGNTVTAKNVILATGSVPFVPPGVQVDGKTVFTSDEALKLEWVPDWIAIIGSGYIGLEFSDVYTALGSEVTFIEAMPRIMFFFDKQIAQLAERLLVRPRNIDYRTNVFASKVTPGIPGQKPVVIEMIDAKTKELVETLEVDACMVCTGRAPYSEGLGLDNVDVDVQRGFVQVNEKMQALDPEGNVIDGLYAIGDLNGKMMLAHAASAQGISAVENMCGDEHILNHDAIPAACFTHPEIAMVGPTEEQARERAEAGGYEIGVSQGSFKANSKALAEGAGDGIAKVIFKKDTYEVIAVHIVGIHAADLIQECSNAIEAGSTLKDLSMMVHTHPTLCEVLDEAFKAGLGRAAH